MGLTISHKTALHATRLIRAEGLDMNKMDHASIARPTPWIGKRWTARQFAPEVWNWRRPSSVSPLDVVVASSGERLRMANVTNHVCSVKLPPNSILWLDEHTTMPCPELLFLQIAEVASLPGLVLLGHELCGHFTRNADNPLGGPIVDNIPSATNVAEISAYLDAVSGLPGLLKARKAIKYVSDQALSAPETVLATIYSLPPEELGYGMGPVTINKRIQLGDDEHDWGPGNRYPDILFHFAPLGINYDGEDHLDLAGLVRAAQQASLADADTKLEMENALIAKTHDVREKAVDDIRRNRQLAAKGYIVFPATKEDLFGEGNLDELTRQILSCAREVFGADIRQYEETLENSLLARERYRLLAAMLPSGRAIDGYSEVV